ETWALALDAAPQWLAIAPSVLPSPIPAARSNGCSAYDCLNNRMLVFGGWHSSTPCPWSPHRPGQTSYLDDSWALDLETDTWSRFLPDGRPAPREFPVAIYDPLRRR